MTTAHTDITIPSRHTGTQPALEAPILLQQHYQGRVDLVSELVARYPGVPLMTTCKTRAYIGRTDGGIATLQSSDGMAAIVVEQDVESRLLQFSYTFGAMQTLHFRMDALSALDRAHWLDHLRREKDGVAFLWGEYRWSRDYLICAFRRQFATFYAFSVHGFESAARLTPEVKNQLLDWLTAGWQADLQTIE
jgi:hypothetical protein